MNKSALENRAFVRGIMLRKEPDLAHDLILLDAEFTPVTVGFGDLDFENGAKLPAYGSEEFLEWR